MIPKSNDDSHTYFRTVVEEISPAPLFSGPALFLLVECLSFENRFSRRVGLASFTVVDELHCT